MKRTGRRPFPALVLVTTTLAVVAAVLAPSAPARAEGRVIVVAGPGTAEVSARATGTIQAAVRRARPGDTILVAGGTYVEAVGYGAVPGREDAPIRLMAAPGQRVLIKGTLQMDGADHWTVQGIDVTYDPGRGRTEFLVKFDGGTGWQFLDAEVWGSRGVSNVMISGSERNGVPRNWRISGACIHDNLATGDPFMNDHNIYLMPGYRSGPGVVERSIFFGAPNGANIKAAGPSAATGAGNVTIRYSTFTRAAAGVIIGHHSHDITMWKNLMGGQIGGSRSYNAAVLGNHAHGGGNRAVYTGTWGYPRSVRSTNDSRRPITGAGTTWLNPRFDSQTSCQGFRPADPRAARLGRYAP